MTNLPLNARTEVILQLLDGPDPAQDVQAILAKSRAEDIAAALAHLGGDERMRLFGWIEDQDEAAEVLSNVDERALQDVVNGMSAMELVDLLERMEPDDATDIVETLPAELRVEVMREMRGAETEEVSILLSWPSDSAGGIMSPSLFRMPQNATCGQAIHLVQHRSDEVHSIYYVYVVNAHNVLVGVVSLRSLLIHPSATTLSSIMDPDVITVSPETDQEEVARFVARYDLLAVPVVDSERRVLGIVTVDDVVDVIREEAVEDMMLMAGVQEDPGPSFRSTMYLVRARAGWLLATIVGGILASELVAMFEATLEQKAVLAGFIPVIMGMGGNVGIQSATITVRGLATGQVQLGGTLAFVWQEARVGVVLGILYGTLLGGYALFRYTDEPAVWISVAVSITLAIISASLFGTGTPVILARLGVDPAVATGPFVTTLVDVFGIVIYLSIASALLFW